MTPSHRERAEKLHEDLFSLPDRYSTRCELIEASFREVENAAIEMCAQLCNNQTYPLECNHADSIRALKSGGE